MHGHKFANIFYLSFYAGQCDDASKKPLNIFFFNLLTFYAFWTIIKHKSDIKYG